MILVTWKSGKVSKLFREASDVQGTLDYYGGLLGTAVRSVEVVA